MHNVGQCGCPAFRAKMLVTIEPKFQITLPAELCQQIGIREGDTVDMTATENGILLRPKEVADRNAVADKINEIFARIKPSPEDAGCSEEEIMEDVIKDIAEARKERRDRGT